jgi:methionyl-tRNA synthetase
MSKTSPCIKCNKRFKILTEEGLCYFCYKDKHGVPPTQGAYKQEKNKK